MSTVKTQKVVEKQKVVKTPEVVKSPKVVKNPEVEGKPVHVQQPVVVETPVVVSTPEQIAKELLLIRLQNQIPEVYHDDLAELYASVTRRRGAIASLEAAIHTRHRERKGEYIGIAAMLTQQQRGLATKTTDAVRELQLTRTSLRAVYESLTTWLKNESEATLTYYTLYKSKAIKGLFGGNYRDEYLDIMRYFHAALVVKSAPNGQHEYKPELSPSCLPHFPKYIRDAGILKSLYDGTAVLYSSKKEESKAAQKLIGPILEELAAVLEKICKRPPSSAVPYEEVWQQVARALQKDTTTKTKLTDDPATRKLTINVLRNVHVRYLAEKHQTTYKYTGELSDDLVRNIRSAMREYADVTIPQQIKNLNDGRKKKLKAIAKLKALDREYSSKLGRPVSLGAKLRALPQAERIHELWCVLEEADGGLDPMAKARQQKQKAKFKKEAEVRRVHDLKSRQKKVADQHESIKGQRSALIKELIELSKKGRSLTKRKADMSGDDITASFEALLRHECSEIGRTCQSFRELNSDDQRDADKLLAGVLIATQDAGKQKTLHERIKRWESRDGDGKKYDNVKDLAYIAKFLEPNGDGGDELRRELRSRWGDLKNRYKTWDGNKWAAARIEHITDVAGIVQRHLNIRKEVKEHGKVLPGMESSRNESPNGQGDLDDSQAAMDNIVRIMLPLTKNRFMTIVSAERTQSEKTTSEEKVENEKGSSSSELEEWNKRKAAAEKEFAALTSAGKGAKFSTGFRAFVCELFEILAVSREYKSDQHIYEFRKALAESLWQEIDTEKKKKRYQQPKVEKGFGRPRNRRVEGFREQCEKWDELQRTREQGQDGAIRTTVESEAKSAAEGIPNVDRELKRKYEQLRLLEHARVWTSEESWERFEKSIKEYQRLNDMLEVATSTVKVNEFSVKTIQGIADRLGSGYETGFIAFSIALHLGVDGGVAHVWGVGVQLELVISGKLSIGDDRKLRATVAMTFAGKGVAEAEFKILLKLSANLRKEIYHSARTFVFQDPKHFVAWLSTDIANKISYCHALMKGTGRVDFGKGKGSVGKDRIGKELIDGFVDQLCELEVRSELDNIVAPVLHEIIDVDKDNAPGKKKKVCKSVNELIEEIVSPTDKKEIEESSKRVDELINDNTKFDEELFPEMKAEVSQLSKARHADLNELAAEQPLRIKATGPGGAGWLIQGWSFGVKATVGKKAKAGPIGKVGVGASISGGVYLNKTRRVNFFRYDKTKKIWERSVRTGIVKEDGANISVKVGGNLKVGGKKGKGNVGSTAVQASVKTKTVSNHPAGNGKSVNLSAKFETFSGLKTTKVRGTKTESLLFNFVDKHGLFPSDERARDKKFQITSDVNKERKALLKELVKQVKKPPKNKDSNPCDGIYLSRLDEKLVTLSTRITDEEAAELLGDLLYVGMYILGEGGFGIELQLVYPKGRGACLQYLRLVQNQNDKLQYGTKIPVGQSGINFKFGGSGTVSSARAYKEWVGTHTLSYVRKVYLGYTNRSGTGEALKDRGRLEWNRFLIEQRYGICEILCNLAKDAGSGKGIDLEIGKGHTTLVDACKKLRRALENPTDQQFEVFLEACDAMEKYFDEANKKQKPAYKWVPASAQDLEDDRNLDDETTSQPIYVERTTVPDKYAASDLRELNKQAMKVNSEPTFRHAFVIPGKGNNGAAWTSVVVNKSGSGPTECLVSGSDGEDHSSDEPVRELVEMLTSAPKEDREMEKLIKEFTKSRALMPK